MFMLLQMKSPFVATSISRWLVLSPRVTSRALSFTIAVQNTKYGGSGCGGDFAFGPYDRNLKKRTTVTAKSTTAIPARHASTHFTNPIITNAQYAIESFQYYSGLPWWLTIICTTIALRATITVPIAVVQQRMMAKMEIHARPVKEIVEAIRWRRIMDGKKEGKSKLHVSTQVFRDSRKLVGDYYKQHGISTMKSTLLPWVQMPLFITLSFALRNISGGYIMGDGNHSYLPALGIETGGCLWFTNLSLPDPYMVIPTIFLVANLLNLEMKTLNLSVTSIPTRMRMLSYSLRMLTCLTFLIATQVPCSMSLYWAFSGCFSLAQEIALCYPKVRRLLKIPKTANEKNRTLPAKREALRLRAARFIEKQRQTEGSSHKQS